MSGVSIGGLVFALMVALLAAATVLAAESWWREHATRKALKRQLKTLRHHSGQISLIAPTLLRADEISGKLTDRWLLRSPFFRDADTLLEQANLPWTRLKLLKLSLGAGVGLGMLVLVLSGSLLAFTVAALVGFLLPIRHVRKRKAKRTSQMEEQLPEAIDLLTRAIRAGHTLSTGMRLVGEEAQDPIASEFRRVFEEQKYGRAFDVSMREMAQRVDLVDARVMVVAMLVQREVGGNLAEVLENISDLIRARFKMRRQVQVHAAQGRMSGYVLSGLPVVVGGVMFLANPAYVRVLFTDPIGKLLLGMGVVLQIIGYFWISRILKVDV